MLTPRTKNIVRPLNREKLCQRCGAPMITSSNRRRKHNECNYLDLSDYDKKILSDYRAVCARYGLSTSVVFNELTGNQKSIYYCLERGISMGKEKKDRLLMILRRFMDDMQKGLYDFKVTPRLWSVRYDINLVRRMEPRTKICPGKVPSCPGACYKGDCPRNWKHCDLSKKGYGKLQAQRDLESVVRDIRDNLGLTGASHIF